MRRGAVFLISIVVAMSGACTEHLWLPVGDLGGGGGNLPGGTGGKGIGTGGTGGKSANTGGGPAQTGGRGGGNGGDPFAQGGRGGDAAGSGAFGQGGHGFGGFDGIGRGPMCGLNRIASYIPRSEVLFSLGKNASMGTEKLGDVTRLSAVDDKVGSQIAANQNAIWFGYQEFPGAASCPGTNGCCVKSGASIPPSPTSSESAIPQALMCAPPLMTDGCASLIDSSPIAAAFENATMIFNTSDPNDKYVVLIVDSEPGCAAEAPQYSCDQAFKQLAALAMNNVKTVVVALGPDAGAPGSCLAKIASQAGPKNLWRAMTPLDLDMALGTILGDAAKASCLIRLKAPANPDSLSIWITNGLRMDEIKHDAVNGGWDVIQGGPFTKILVKGDSCALIQKAQDSQIEIYGCSF